MRADTGKTNVLFVCVHNSARSQMAEAFFKKYGGKRFFVESAGFEPGQLNPLAIEAMNEAGIDISQHKTQSVFELFKQGKRYDYVITVCDESRAQQCPVFPGTTLTKRMHWSFDDPAGSRGTRQEKLRDMRRVRDNIKRRVREFISREKL